MATATALTEAERIALRSAMARGVLRVCMPDGAEVQYASLAEMQAVLDRDAQDQAAAAGGTALSFATWARD